MTKFTMEGKAMEKKDKFSDEFDGRGTGGYHVLMDTRITKLEAIAEQTDHRLRAIESDLAIIKSNYVTKADLSEAIERQTWKLVSFVCGFNIALITATVFIVKNVL